jgi:hypothetical protein
MPTNDELSAHWNRFEFDIEAVAILVGESDADPCPAGLLGARLVLVFLNNQKPARIPL